MKKGIKVLIGILIAGVIIGTAFIFAKKISNNNGNSNNVQFSVNNRPDVKFSYKDMVVDNLKYGMTEEQVKEMKGEPTKIIDSKIDEEGAESTDLYGDSITYIYDNLTLGFYEHDGKMVLSMAATSNKDYTFTNGLKVGCTKNDVLSSFYRENENEKSLRDVYSIYDTTNSYGKYLYGHVIGATDFEKTTEKVESGLINYYGYNEDNYEGTYMIEYHYTEPPYQGESADSTDECGLLVFDMNHDNVVTCIRWYFYPTVQ